MKRSIKSYVLRRLGEGASKQVVWREVAREFPFACNSWGYICQLDRTRSRALQARAAIREALAGERVTPIDAPPKIIVISTPN